MAKKEKEAVAVAEPQIKEVKTSKTPKWEIKDRVYELTAKKHLLYSY